MTDVRAAKVSIVLPTYNGARYLRDAIDSCLSQSHTNIELIIVDDASSDTTPQIIGSYHDERIHAVRNQHNTLLPGALNVGFACAHGDYLTWTSDDNILKQNTIKRLLEYMLEKKTEFVYADFYKFTGNDLGSAVEVKLSRTQDFSKRNDVGPCFLYTRKLQEQIGEYDTETFLAEDYDYWIRVSKKYMMDHLHQPLYYYRDHTTSLTVARSLEVKTAGALVLLKNEMTTPTEAVDYIIESLAGSNFPTRHLGLNRFLIKRRYSGMLAILNDYHEKKVDFQSARKLLVAVFKTVKKYF